MRMVGALLALFREAAGYTQKTLGERFVVGEQQIASIEQGRRPLKPDLAEQLDELLDTKGALVTALSRMPEVDLVPLWAEEYLDREREAIAVSWYESLLVPGLLQTEAYARAVFRNRVPLYDEDEIEQLVAARIERREILHRKVPPMMSLVIWEAPCGTSWAGRTCTSSRCGTYGSTPTCPVSPSRSCRSAAPRTQASKARSSCWRPLSTSGWHTAKPSAVAR
jgi:transcriptional regulator with XRE-family HTH domain